MRCIVSFLVYVDTVEEEGADNTMIIEDLQDACDFSAEDYGGGAIAVAVLDAVCSHSAVFKCSPVSFDVNPLTGQHCSDYEEQRREEATLFRRGKGSRLPARS